MESKKTSTFLDWAATLATENVTNNAIAIVFKFFILIVFIINYRVINKSLFDFLTLGWF